MSAGYELEGSLLEVCSCDVLCPCWVGEDPDFDTADLFIVLPVAELTTRYARRFLRAA